MSRRAFLAGAAVLQGSAALPASEIRKISGKIKIGQIGVGHGHASGKMRVYRRSDEYEIVGVVEPNAELRQQAQKSTVYEDLTWMTQEQLLNVPGLQAVAVETRVRDLLDVAETCVEAGLHIHLDKPAGTSLPQFRKILGIAQRKHLLVQMGYMYRYNPAVVLLRKFLKESWLGEPFELHSVMSKVVPAASRKRLAEFPGGMMLELGCHLIDLVVAILGPPENVTPFIQHASSTDDGLRDNMLAVLAYPKCLATVKSTAMEVKGFGRRHLVVCGTEGTFHIQPLDSPSIRIALPRPHEKYPKGYQEIEIGRYERYVADATDMARIIRFEKDTDYPSEHDLAVQRTVLKASGMPSG